MCGKPLDDPALEAPARDVPDWAQDSGAAEHRQVEAEPPTPAPAHTGGPFQLLGRLSDPPSRNLEYLLEDDEPRSHKGLVVGIAALALVAGLGYLRWRNGGLAFLKLGSSGAKTTTQTTDSSPATAAPDQPTAPAASTTAPPTHDGPAAPATTPAATPAPTPVPAPPTTAAASSVSTPSAPADNAPAESKSATTPADSGAPAGDQAAPPASTGDQAGAAPATSSAPPAEIAPVVAAPAPVKAKPKPKPLPPPKPEDSVAMGERYLYGRGVAQDCTRGLRYVKPAADQSNAKAMITMGALYATGHCLPRDLPTAYRFFALALRKDPENGPLKQNAEMVWGQMTEAERQQAIRMTQ